MDIEVRQPNATGRNRESSKKPSGGGDRGKLIAAGVLLVLAGGVIVWWSGLLSGSGKPAEITIEEAYAAPEETATDQPQRQQWSPRVTGDN